MWSNVAFFATISILPIVQLSFPHAAGIHDRCASDLIRVFVFGSWTAESPESLPGVSKPALSPVEGHRPEQC